MRKLACFSFAFAVGVLPELLGFSRWITCALLGLSAVAAAIEFLRKGRRERVIAICALGLCCGLLRAGLYRVCFLEKAEAAASDPCMISVELSNYPEPREYGCEATGYMEQNGVRFRVTLYLGSYDAGWKPGDVVTGAGSLETADTGTEGRWYYRSVGIPMRAALFKDVSVVSAEAVPSRYWPAMLSQALKERIRILFPEDVQGYMRALLTGDKDGLSYLQKSDLQVAGVYHALAVSGMHVSILMSVLAFLTMRNRRLYPLLGIPVLLFYCLMVGGTSSVIRASVMQTFLMAGALFRRESDAPTSLGASLLLLTAVNPWCLMNTGLQLSFLATAGILFFQPRIHHRLIAYKPSRLKKLWYSCMGIVATTLSALVLTLPLMAWYFGMVSLMSVLSNLLMLQAITAAFFLGFLGCGLFGILPAVGKIIAFPATWLLRYVAWCAKWIARIPFAAVYTDTPYLIVWLVFSYGLLLWLLLRRKPASRKLWVISGSWIVILLCIGMLCTWQDRCGGEFVFTALDVGQGQCLLYRSGGDTAAVDCGDGDEDGELLARTLLSGGQTHLHYLILTHYDKDHVGGARQLLNRVRVDVLLMPDLADDSGTREDLETLASACGTQICYVTEDLEIDFGEGTLNVFAPVSASGGNASSLAILATFGDYDILVTGDMPMSSETRLLERHSLPDVELLVAGHHGSAYSTGEELLSAVTPELVVISVGWNSYGHPADAVLERIEAAGAATLRTDRNGTIIIRR